MGTCYVRWEEVRLSEKQAAVAVCLLAGMREPADICWVTGCAAEYLLRMLATLRMRRLLTRFFHLREDIVAAPVLNPVRCRRCGANNACLPCVTCQRAGRQRLHFLGKEEYDEFISRVSKFVTQLKEGTIDAPSLARTHKRQPREPRKNRSSRVSLARRLRDAAPG